MKKKKRNKIKRLLLFIIFAFFAFCMLKTFVFKNKSNYNYSEQVLNSIGDYSKHKLESKKYSKTLEEIILNNLFIEDYLDEYISINYQENDNFLNNINTFLKKGYSSKEINDIYKLSDLNIIKLLNYDHLNIEKYINIKNFNIDNYNRYETYASKNDYDIKDVVTYVNVNVDLDPYVNTSITDNPDNYLVLVNKYNGLEKGYKPKDLVTVSGYYGNSVSMRKVAKEALIEFQNAIKEEIGTTLLPTTAYRDYSFQSTLYNNYVAKDGVKAADTYSARPGYSEHQTGLAIDLKNPKLTNIRLNDNDYSWVKENAYKYGFIVRFPKNKEFITGYTEENWHIRYVGLEAAKIIHDDNLSLEEYIDLYIKEY